MPKLFVLDAMGLVYRAYYALIRTGLSATTKAGASGTVRHRGFELVEGIAKPPGGELTIEAEDGATLESHVVPGGASVRVADGAAVRSGDLLMRQNSTAISGMATLLLKIRREEQPDYWALAWDGPGPTFRHERYAEYKATRKPMPDELRSQLQPIRELARAVGLPVLEIPGTEADDLMATLAHRGAREGLEVVLVTMDKDMLQSVEPGVTVFVPSRGAGDEWERIDAEGVKKYWKVGPEGIRDVLALMGDTSDNIPGVPGIGEKTAVELMQTFGSLESLYERLDEVTKPALKRKLMENRDAAFLSRELVTLQRDLDLPVEWESIRCAPIEAERLQAFFDRWEIKRVRGATAEAGAPGASARFTAPPAPAPVRSVLDAPPRPVAPVSPVALQSTLDLWSADAGGDVDARALTEKLHEVRARAIHGLAILPLSGPGEPRTAPLVGIALAARDGTSCYVPLAHASGPNLDFDQVREWLRPAFADSTVPKVAHDVKRAQHLLAGAGLPFEAPAFDLHVASFLLDPSREHGLVELARDAAGLTLPPLTPPAVRGRPRPSFADAAVGPLAELAGHHVAAIYPIADHLRAQLEAREQWSLYTQLEHPLIPVLLDMERNGVRLDPAVLGAMRAEVSGQIGALADELQALAGEPINLLSGPQVAKVLFEKLGLKPGRRTKTGFSTDEAVLEELSDAHPFPKKLLEYRALTKLSSTYLEALPEAIDPRDGRVHTTYHQTGAATGRLSSSDPNLQNIPMRTPQGRAIRRAFVAPPGGVLIGADYSQIELRVMAHLSGDPNLIEAFASGEDIHAATARRIFGVEGEIDPTLRSRAKVVNFGVMYGMGPRSLSQQMGIAMSEAQEFIAGYFRTYARVREFLDHTIQETRERGWVQTILGRRRYLPQITSANGAERSFAERAAINAPIQGSAADLMKLAMIRVHRAVREFRGARLLLQVHDELVLECRAEDAELVRERVRREMEGCYTLRVPLVVSVGAGASWFDVH